MDEAGQQVSERDLPTPVPASREQGFHRSSSPAATARAIAPAADGARARARRTADAILGKNLRRQRGRGRGAGAKSTRAGGFVETDHLLLIDIESAKQRNAACSRK